MSWNWFIYSKVDRLVWCTFFLRSCRYRRWLCSSRTVTSGTTQDWHLLLLSYDCSLDNWMHPGHPELQRYTKRRFNHFVHIISDIMNPTIVLKRRIVNCITISHVTGLHSVFEFINGFWNQSSFDRSRWFNKEETFLFALYIYKFSGAIYHVRYRIFTSFVHKTGDIFEENRNNKQLVVVATTYVLTKPKSVLVQAQKWSLQLSQISGSVTINNFTHVHE